MLNEGTIRWRSNEGPHGVAAGSGASAPGPPYSVRFDFNGSGQITLADVLQFSEFFGKSCTP